MIFTGGARKVSDTSRIETALGAVGDLLEAGSVPVDVVVVGGATLNLAGDRQPHNA